MLRRQDIGAIEPPPPRAGDGAGGMKNTQLSSIVYQNRTKFDYQKLQTQKYVYIQQTMWHSFQLFFVCHPRAHINRVRFPF